MTEVSSLVKQLQQGDSQALARAITIVENDLEGSEILLESLSIRDVPLIGITGPPGAGKSSLVNSLISFLLSGRTASENNDVKIGVVTVDPTSPFNFGSLLGDRIRMAEHFSHKNVFIRSLATRGSLGGLSEKIIEVTDVMKSAPFDFLFVETVGVGQSEVEIAGLADTTIVVLVPEAGDEVQTMKAGLMEIADIFVVNKADHVDADRFAKNLKSLTASRMNGDWQIPIVKTVAIRNEGIEELLEQIQKHHESGIQNERRVFLLAEKVWRIIAKEKMKDVDRKKILEQIRLKAQKGEINVYQEAKNYE
ncbi:MAG TPA: methylmalonyl Co-A mutase-associated GTPase MeaB [Chitinophagales bacterium]|nr:methylmalonyl Co-A mutase-associated GTPase MeaB [Chitinophagales bacterium]